MEEFDKLDLMVMAARMYYEEGLAQVEIAEKLNISRPTVSRLLSEARQRKMVEVKIHYPWRSDPVMEDEIKNAFALQDVQVLVAKEMNEDDIQHGVGVMGARLIDRYLKDGMTLAISRGRGVYSTIQQLHPRLELNIDVVQIQGAMGDSLEDGSDIASFLRGCFQGKFHYLHAPLLLENPLSAEILIKDASIRSTLDKARKADIALIGIGSVDPSVSNLYRHQLLSLDELEQLEQEGIVGDIAGRFYGIDGVEVADNPINQRIVSLELEEIKKIPIVIGVASGLAKVKSVRAALKAHNVNMLAVDSVVAYHLLKD
jgi:DNA-binding transcriptional regulator LsrR (DeoR family)